MPFSHKRRIERSAYGIGEWYGRSFMQMSDGERRQFSEIQLLPKRERPTIICPARSSVNNVLCTKDGGICSLRLYQQSIAGDASSVPGDEGQLCTTCPYRFYENNIIFQWIGEKILGNTKPTIVGEIGFLERDENASADRSDRIGREDVGRIDHVLVHPDISLMAWCAVEMQAVYFSGESMAKDFRDIAVTAGEKTPFPLGRRHPDFRSSGPKRLMPQLQIKVPTLRRWGKKMCVVVDRMFFGALGRMETVSDVSNCDIAWFVVRYDEDGARLRPDSIHLTTLERSVEGLTAGVPVSLREFEERIKAKLARQ